MCGIAAVLLYPMQRSPQVWDEIRSTFTRNLLENEVRGKSATGVVTVWQDGAFETCKQPLPASVFVRQPEYQAILRHISEQTTCILGHTRKPTKGHADNNNNNHPLIAGYHIGVHNGTIRNDDLLFQRLNLPRLGEVDSEVIFRLYNEVTPHDSHYARKLVQKAALLQGIFSTISLDLRNPQGLVVTRRHAPLCVHYHDPWQAIIFSSRYIFLRKTFGKTVTTETLQDGTLAYFHAAQIPAGFHAPLYAYPLSLPEPTELSREQY